MYIWLGIHVDDQFAAVGKQAKEIERCIGFTHSNFTLPLHISLKISFPVADELFDTVVHTVENYYKTLSPFDIKIHGIENEGTTAWIRMERNPTLDRIHDDLNGILLEQYGVPLHEYDTDYKYHTTLFMDSDTQKISAACEQLGSVPLPDTLRADHLLIGCSPTGALGTYKVYREYFL